MTTLRDLTMLRDLISLRDLIRKVAADHPGESPTLIAHYVAKKTPHALIEEFYTQALRGVVNEVLGYSRRSSMDRALSGAAAAPVSAKLAERRRYFSSMMEESVRGREGWKLLGDCTIDDLKFCIEDRLALIDRTQGQIDYYSRIICLMEQHRVGVARDLVGKV